MTDWVRVKDKRTGHEYSVASPDSDVHDVLDKPAADAGGQPLPAKPFFDHMRESIAAGRTPAGRVKLEQARKDVANQMMSLLPVEQAKAIIANGQQMDFLEHIEDFADGYITPSNLTARYVASATLLNTNQ
jgi:hypothetical protein